LQTPIPAILDFRLGEINREGGRTREYKSISLTIQNPKSKIDWLSGLSNPGSTAGNY